MDLARLRGLIVSCQAHGDHPLRDPYVISALAECAERGGAAAIRDYGPEDARAIRERVSLPIIGIQKVPLSGRRFATTPTLDHCRGLARAGARVRLVAEWQVRTPERAGELYRRGAHSVVVGASITDPVEITSRFADAAREAAS